MTISVPLKEAIVRHKKAAMAAALFLFLGSWLCWYFSDQQAVRRQVVGLAWDASKKSQEGTMETAFKMRSIRSALAGRCQIVVQENSYDEFMENDLLIRYLMYYRDRFESIDVVFEDMHIDIPNKGNAIVRSLVSVHKSKKGHVSPTTVQAPAVLGLKKQDGRWLLHMAKLAAVLVDE